jgi:hypothetical protein
MTSRPLWPENVCDATVRGREKTRRKRQRKRRRKKGGRGGFLEQEAERDLGTTAYECQKQ